MERLFLGARVINPASGYNNLADILVRDGKIERIGQDLAPEYPNAEKIEVNGLVAAPGLVDMHCHLRQPGFEYKEDILSGTASAAVGGFTSVAPMPNTNPVCDTPEKVRELLAQPAHVQLLPIASITKKMEGKELTNLRELHEAGAVAVSDDGKPVADSALMRAALEEAHLTKMAVVSHCEDPYLGAGGGMNEGALARRLGYKGVSAAAEEIMIARELLLARTTGMPVHIAHVSTAVGVELIRFAKQNRVRVTAETCPHYFSLSQNAVERYGTAAKMNPPLRTEEDREAVIRGLRDGTLDVIATDHAPHGAEEKAQPFDQAPSGITGFETALGLGILCLVRPGHLTLAHLLEKMTAIPAAVLRVEKGTLQPGADADIVFFDPEEPYVYEADQSLSKARNTPFDGWTLYGRPRYTVRAGEIIAQDGKLK